MSTTANYLKEIKVPQNYSDYYEELSQQVYKEFETCRPVVIVLHSNQSNFEEP